jgi:hypothetical protein
MAELPVDKVKELVNHVKANADELAAKGADKKELQANVAKLEAEMKKPAPNHGVLSDLLASLETSVEKDEESMVSKGVFQLLNQILGTGVPNP